MITAIINDGYVVDRFGNYKKTIDGRIHRYKFNTTSYRHEISVDTTPKSWMKIAGTYYKHIVINENGNCNI